MFPGISNGYKKRCRHGHGKSRDRAYDRPATEPRRTMRINRGSTTDASVTFSLSPFYGRSTCKNVRNARLKNNVVPIGTNTRTGIFLTPMKVIMAIRNTMVTTSNVENVYAKDKIPMVTYGTFIKAVLHSRAHRGSARSRPSAAFLFFLLLTPSCHSEPRLLFSLP